MVISYTSKKKYQVSAPKTPGASPTVLSTHSTLREARKAARSLGARRDLTRQDVRIERTTDIHVVEYAGPSR